jgi:LacI family transcriptional regulator
MLGKMTPHVAIGPLLAVRRDSTRGSGRREPRILEAVEMIRREACDGLTAEKLAKRFAGSRRHFERRFREATGHSVLDEILHVRLDKAFTLLAETDTAIGAIYAHCGFRSPRALDFLVHDRTGMSMREWRRRNARK